jgi:hypothetical protein
MFIETVQFSVCSAVDFIEEAAGCSHFDILSVMVFLIMGVEIVRRNGQLLLPFKSLFSILLL